MLKRDFDDDLSMEMLAGNNNHAVPQQLNSGVVLHVVSEHHAQLAVHPQAMVNVQVAPALQHAQGHMPASMVIPITAAPPVLQNSLSTTDESSALPKAKKAKTTMDSLGGGGKSKRGGRKKREEVAEEEGSIVVGGVSSRGRERKPKSFAFSDEQAQFAYSLNASNSQRYQRRIKGDAYDDGELIFLSKSGNEDGIAGGVGIDDDDDDDDDNDGGGKAAYVTEGGGAEQQGSRAVEVTLAKGDGGNRDDDDEDDEDD